MQILHLLPRVKEQNRQPKGIFRFSEVFWSPEMGTWRRKGWDWVQFVSLIASVRVGRWDNMGGTIT